MRLLLRVAVMNAPPPSPPPPLHHHHPPPPLLPPPPHAFCTACLGVPSKCRCKCRKYIAILSSHKTVYKFWSCHSRFFTFLSPTGLKQMSISIVILMWNWPANSEDMPMSMVRPNVDPICSTSLHTLSSASKVSCPTFPSLLNKRDLHTTPSFLLFSKISQATDPLC